MEGRIAMNKTVKEDKTKIKSTVEIEPKIYAWTETSSSDFAGWVKIGYTEKQTVQQRIKQSTGQTLSKPQIEWQYDAKYFSGGYFKDHDFHRTLSRKHKIPRKKGTEWFDFNPEGASKSEDFIREFLLGKKQTKFELKRIDYLLRGEQQEAIEMAKKYFLNNPNSEFLWNAKPRFGKTLASYDLAKKMNAQTILIVTNRPAIANSWLDDYEEFVELENYYLFVSETESLRNRETLNRKSFNEEKAKRTKNGRETGLIEFLSLQDLKGSKYFGGTHDKLKYITNIDWDLLIIDEAHEGVDTFKTDVAFEYINRKNTLHLSGTPFKALANNKFLAEQIYNWSYQDEQQAKNEWDAKAGYNPYEKLPTLSLFTYKLSGMITEQINQGANLAEDNGIDYAFDLNEFFGTDDKGKFNHESEVKKFLDRLVTGEKFPFSTKQNRDEIKHSFWLLNRVASVKALEKLLKNHPVFENYKIVLAVEKQEDNQKAYDKVQEAIGKFDKTITLSVGQLTTGVTIPEWTAVMMLSNITSPSLYMQAAFRAQNPWEYETNGRLSQKENAYIFDFAPERTLIIFDEFANNLNRIKTNTTEERSDNIKELLNFFPVIAEDDDGKMVELNATEVLTMPKALKAHEVVRRGFMSNLLFDNISGVFSYPKQLISILEKLPEVELGKMKQQLTQLEIPADLAVDEQGQVQSDENIVISKTEAIFGKKVFKPQITQIIDEILPENSSEKTKAKSIAQTVVATTITPAISTISDYVEVEIKQAQVDKIKKDAEVAVVKVVEAEKIRFDIKTSTIEADAKDQIKEAEEALDYQKIAQLENQKMQLVAEARAEYTANLKEKVNEAVEAKQKEIVREQNQKVEQKKANKTMEDVRSRLRGFARTIPSFIMAYGDRGLKLENFDVYTPSDVFAEITGITIAQFKQLRDGTTIKDADGNDVEVKGLFDAPTFDTAIHEFLDKKEALANYFNPKLTEDIFDYIPAQKTNQIFTPKPVVKMMVDVLEQENSGIFANPDAKFVDLYTKSGLFQAELVKRLHVGLVEVIPDEQERLTHILKNQVFGLAPSEIITKIASNYLYIDVDYENIKQLDLVPFIKQNSDRAKEQIKEVFGEMKFDVVIGNPPYQGEATGERTLSLPVYHLFMETSYTLSDKSILITPARFLFNAGATPSVWNKKMLADEHLKVVYFEQESSKVFPNTDIKGGVAVTYRDTSVKLESIGVFTAYEELNSILKKTEKKRISKEFGELRFLHERFDTSELYKDYPEFENRLDVKAGRRLTSPIFDILPEIFFDEPLRNVECIRIYGRQKNERVFKYIERRYIEDNEKLDKYKVLLPAINGSGAIGEVLSTPLIGEPLIGHTQTFISLGAFETEYEAIAMLKYLKGKFSRAMLGVLKITQDNKTKEVWSKVPLQDFTSQSDIDWSKSIPEIDQQLYAKYGLDQTEIEFIETKVRTME